MPMNLPLELREEFRTPHMRGTAIELRNRQGTGWTQREPTELLRISYPTADVLGGLDRGAAQVVVARHGDPEVHRLRHASTSLLKDDASVTPRRQSRYC